MFLSRALDRLHARVKSTLALQHFTAVTRVLLAVGFVPPGMVKVLGIPFTSLPPETPVGYFFSAFHRADLWYHFVGWAQVTAAVLLLFPRTATLGAVLYFPIIVNITAVTLAIDFAGTSVITVLMTLASLYLLCWDYDRLKTILPHAQRKPGRWTHAWIVAYTIGFAVLSVAGYTALAALHVANLHLVGPRGAVPAALAGAIFGLVCALHLRALPERATRPTPRGVAGANPSRPLRVQP